MIEFTPKDFVIDFAGSEKKEFKGEIEFKNCESFLQNVILNPG